MAHTDIATQITRIQNGVSTQADLLSQIETALENKTSQSITLQEKIITPTASQQIILPDAGYDGLSQITVNGDSNLVSENIAEGISIFGINGSFQGGAKVQTGSTYHYLLTSSPSYIQLSIGFKPSYLLLNFKLTTSNSYYTNAPQTFGYDFTTSNYYVPQFAIVSSPLLAAYSQYSYSVSSYVTYTESTGIFEFAFAHTGGSAGSITSLSSLYWIAIS